MNAGAQYRIEQAAALLSEVLSRKDQISQTEQEKLTDIRARLTGLYQKSHRIEPFHQWLDKQKNRRDRIGELARLSEQDKKWPRTGDGALAAFVERLRLTNLTKDGPQVPGLSGSDMIEHYLLSRLG